MRYFKAKLLCWIAALALLGCNLAASAEDNSAGVVQLQEKLIETSENVSQAVVSIHIIKQQVRTDWLFGPYSIDVSYLGSGIIINRDCCVLTNAHVVEGADQIKVALPDGREFEARVTGKDPALDIAVLNLQGLEGQSLPTAPLGDSEKLRLGQIVLAMGNPYGSEEHLNSPQPTITMGIVSALNRTFPSSDPRRVYGSLVQTDAAINRGNSGGPLVNLDGEVVGINVAIFSTSAGSQGIGFAIPINDIKKRLKRLQSGEELSYGFLGVQLSPYFDKRTADHLKIKYVQGVLIRSLPEDGPAAKAGIEPYDVITAIDGKRIIAPSQLLSVIQSSGPGSDIEVTIHRNGKKKNIRVTLGEYSK
jgi:S1-C subfamily serine protease